MSILKRKIGSAASVCCANQSGQDENDEKDRLIESLQEQLAR